MDAPLQHLYRNKQVCTDTSVASGLLPSGKAAIFAQQNITKTFKKITLHMHTPDSQVVLIAPR